MTSSGGDLLDLLDWKRRIFALYERIRSTADPRAAWEEWRLERDELFRSHPQSPIPEPQRGGFDRLSYYDYDAALRIIGEIESTESHSYEIAGSTDGTYSFTRFARASFLIAGTERSLELYWLEGYGGGLFLPFRDATSGKKTYGAGRYLFDTVKGADLGATKDNIVLDFNFAYNPSCSYDPMYACPLAPPPNHIDLPIEAGEQHRDR